MEVLFTKRSVISVLNNDLLSEFGAERLKFLEGRSFTKLKDTAMHEQVCYLILKVEFMRYGKSYFQTCDNGCVILLCW